MPYLALVLLILCCFKTFYYGMYEFKEKQNKSGGIAICLLAILRTHFSKYCYYFILYYLIDDCILLKKTVTLFIKNFHAILLLLFQHTS